MQELQLHLSLPFTELVFANFIYLPIANKIRLHYQFVALYKEMTLIGLLAIAQGDNSLLLERRLSGYIDRASY